MVTYTCKQDIVDEFKLQKSIHDSWLPEKMEIALLEEFCKIWDDAYKAGLNSKGI